MRCQTSLVSGTDIVTNWVPREAGSETESGAGCSLRNTHGADPCDGRERKQGGAEGEVDL